MKVTESKLRRIIKSVIRENYEDMPELSSPMNDQQTPDSDCYECQELCSESLYLVSILAKDGCKDSKKAKEFFAILERFKDEVFNGRSNWQEKEKKIRAEYMHDKMLINDLYHMCIKDFEKKQRQYYQHSF